MSAEVEASVPVMPLHDWHLHRRRLMAEEERERAHDLGGARPHIQAAVTERAIRELYARVQMLEEQLREKTRGGGEPHGYKPVLKGP